jgi:thiosulfate/3-mercaptopyruvate sulfurtransferase
MSEYANPDVLVSTEWVAAHRNDADTVVVEVDVDTKAYDEGHIADAVGWNWKTQLCDTVQRDIIPKDELEKLMTASGIANDTTVILYGDNNNWFAAWAFWQMKIYGHANLAIMDGGRKKWLAENRDLSKVKPSPRLAAYKASDADQSLRAYMSQVSEAMKNGVALVDVRSPDEFSGKILSPPGLPETCQRGGHIPGSQNIPWAMACNEDGTFKSYAELQALYGGKGVTAEKDVIAYCRIGERSSHTWFVLKYLLGYRNVKNYDGSWTEWGNLVGAAVERGA